MVIWSFCLFNTFTSIYSTVSFFIQFCALRKMNAADLYHLSLRLSVDRVPYILQLDFTSLPFIRFRIISLYYYPFSCWILRAKYLWTSFVCISALGGKIVTQSKCLLNVPATIIPLCTTFNLMFRIELFITSNTLVSSAFNGINFHFRCCGHKIQIYMENIDFA